MTPNNQTPNYQNFSTWIISTLLGIVSYTGLFLFLLGIKIIRHAADSRFAEIWFVAAVVVGTLTIVITLTAVILIFFDRTLSGRFFFIAAILGANLVAMSTANIILISPVKAALGLGKYTCAGLVFGNGMIVIINFTSFFFKIPPLL